MYIEIFMEKDEDFKILYDVLTLELFCISGHFQSRS